MSEHRLPALAGPLTQEQIDAQMATGHSVFSPSSSEMSMTCEESLVINVLAFYKLYMLAAKGVWVDWMLGNFLPEDLVAGVFTSEDAREGAAAFAEKRAPNWKGK